MKQTTFNKIVKNIKQNYPHFAEDEIKDGVITIVEDPSIIVSNTHPIYGIGIMYDDNW